MSTEVHRNTGRYRILKLDSWLVYIAEQASQEMAADVMKKTEVKHRNKYEDI